MRLCILAIAGLLATSALALPAAAEPATDVCHNATGSQDCIAVLCGLLASNPVVPGRAPDCVSALCSTLLARGLVKHCTASEVLCQDVQPLYATTLRPPAVAAVGSLISTLTNNGLPATGLPVLQSILVRAGFYCDPPPPGQGGSGCPEVFTSYPVRVWNRDFVFHDLGLGTVPLLSASDCLWVLSTTGGTLWVFQGANGVDVVNLGGPSTFCQLIVQAVVTGPAFGTHTESVRIVYC